MKKTLAMILALVMLLALGVPCFAEEAAPEHIAGMLASSGGTEEDADKVAEENFEDEPFSNKFFPDLSSMLLALKAGKINSAGCLPQSTAEYIIARNDELEAAPSGYMLRYFMCAMKDNTEVYNTVNDALSEIIADGTVDQLVHDYIDAYIEAGNEPAAIELPVFEGAKTISIGVTGDLPPFDFVAADGTPAGFNVALLAEISNRAKVNIELVQITSEARPMALNSGKVDLIYWAREAVPVDNGEVSEGAEPYVFEIPADAEAIGPFYESEAYFVMLKR